MFDYRLSFDNPSWLLLLGLPPLLWAWSHRSLAGLGRWRRWRALALRSLLIALLVLALAEVQLVQVSDRVAVLYLVDRSLSIPEEKIQAAMEYVNASIRRQRDQHREDLVGVIAFGREAAVEVPPVAFDMQLAEHFETAVDAEATNLQAALRLAGALFPADASKRIVIVSDGNQTVGDALDQARVLAEQGVGIDVVPLHRAPRSDVAVEKVMLPPQARRGAPFDARVVVNATRPDGDARPIAGRLRVYRIDGEREQLLAEQRVALEPGKKVFRFREELRAADFYTYEARFVADSQTDDAVTRNNRAVAFTHVRGQGRVLLIEDWTAPGQYDHLVERLRRADVEVAMRTSDRPFDSLADLQRFDAVILANVPRVTGDDAEQITTFSDRQINLLARNTQQMGHGLVMLGGPNSFGAGGWTNTALEKAMPVDFQVKSAKVTPVGALMLVIDSSGSMSGQKLQLSKAAAEAAVRVLGRRDYVGVVAFDSEAHWVVPMQRIESPDRVARQIARLAAGGGTNMQPAMTQGYQELLAASGAALRHMIVLTDGQTQGTGYEQMAAAMRGRGVTTTCVAVGDGAARALLNGIASRGGGKFYFVKHPRAIPRIFMKEALRVARPLVYENPDGIAPQLVFGHEMLRGVAAPLPPVTGYVLTTPKDSPLVEIPLEAPAPKGRTNALLAGWQYGLGRAVAYTSDGGRRWAKAWTGWEGYDKFFSQIVRWAMRPAGGDDHFQLATEVEDGKVRAIVTALDEENQFLNFLDITGAVVEPDGSVGSLQLRQVAPGRYVGKFPTDQTGNYFLSISPRPGHAPLRAAASVSRAEEFAARESNEPLLKSLAALAPAGGPPGKVIAEPVGEEALRQALRTNVFRRDLAPATSRRDAWHQMVFLFACLLLADVFNRRVALDWSVPRAAARRWWASLLRKEAPAAPSATAARLAARKQEIGAQLADRKARFESNSAAPGVTEDLPVSASETRVDKPPVPPGVAPDEEAESYTARLLKAKRAARDGGK
jgi:Mg-chelatase subunit ChlD